MSDSTSDSKSPGNHRKPGHKRLTPEQVKQHWKLGDYTASGYLIHLLGALKRDGWVVDIPNVAEFCQLWEIGERRFYRAKAKLIEQGRLGERIKGRLKLWIITDTDKVVRMDGDLDEDEENSDDSSPDIDDRETDSSVIETDSSVIETDSSVIETDSSVIETDSSVMKTDSGDSGIPPKVLPGEALPTSPDLFQISFRSSSSLSHSHPPHPGERETELLNDGQPIDSYRKWLLKRAEELPKRPALIDKWITKQAQDPINQQAFLKSQQRSVRANLPPPRTGAIFELPKQARLTPAEHLERCQQMWNGRPMP
jgi:hypothetical protein